MDEQKTLTYIKDLINYYLEETSYSELITSLLQVGRLDIVLNILFNLRNSDGSFKHFVGDLSVHEVLDLFNTNLGTSFKYGLDLPEHLYRVGSSIGRKFVYLALSGDDHQFKIIEDPSKEEWNNTIYLYVENPDEILNKVKDLPEGLKIFEIPEKSKSRIYKFTFKGIDLYCEELEKVIELIGSYTLEVK